MSKPLISVVTALYNGERYIAETVQSILSQTIQDFEFIIVDDCSTDHGLEIVEKFKDPRIVIIKNSSNLKLTATRNIGLDRAQGRFIALIDHDDVAFANRFEIQLNAFERNQRLILVGSGAINIDESGNQLSGRPQYIESPNETRARLLIRNHFVNSTILFKASSQNKIRYRTEFPLAEDYDFIVRMADFGEVHILPNILLKYRLHGSNYSKVMNEQMLILSGEVKRYQLAKMGIFPNEEEYAIHRSFEHFGSNYTNTSLGDMASWLNFLLKKNSAENIYEAQALERVITDELLNIAEKAALYGPESREILFNPIFLNALSKSPLLIFKCLLKISMRESKKIFN